MLKNYLENRRKACLIFLKNLLNLKTTTITKTKQLEEILIEIHGSFLTVKNLYKEKSRVVKNDVRQSIANKSIEDRKYSSNHIKNILYHGNNMSNYENNVENISDHENKVLNFNNTENPIIYSFLVNGEECKFNVFFEEGRVIGVESFDNGVEAVLLGMEAADVEAALTLYLNFKGVPCNVCGNYYLMPFYETPSNGIIKDEKVYFCHYRCFENIQNEKNIIDG